jgi:hypothetical protein
MSAVPGQRTRGVPTFASADVPVVGAIDTPISVCPYRIPAQPPRGGQPVSPPSAWTPGTAPPGRLVDGLPTAFRARNLVVGMSRASVDLAAELPSAAAAGTATFRFRGLSTGGTVVREFTLGPLDSLKIDVTPYENVEIDLVWSSIPRADAWAIASSSHSTPDTSTLVAVSAPGAGVYPVPPGAFAMVAAQADAGFRWQTPDKTVGNVDIPVAVVAGTSYPVAGRYYLCTAAFRAVWQVSL